MLLLIDNYDSFTYNLYHYLGELGAPCVVLRNDACTASEALSDNIDGIVISPGPRTPDFAGMSIEAVSLAAEKKLPLLGVCLGLQAIAQAFGGRIIRSHSLYHGKTSDITHRGDSLFRGVPERFVATRYHSLIVERETLPDIFAITAETSENGDSVIMGLRHKELAIMGVQFHPESIATEHGRAILGNFLAEAGYGA